MTSPTAYWTGILSDVLDRYTLSELVKPRARLRALLSVASSPCRHLPACDRPEQQKRAGKANRAFGRIVADPVKLPAKEAQLIASN
jgi:hypothetical protein